MIAGYRPFEPSVEQLTSVELSFLEEAPRADNNHHYYHISACFIYLSFSLDMM